MPLVREYVYQLHTLSQQVLDLSGKIDKEKLLRMFRTQVARLLMKYPALHNNIPFIAIYRSPDFGTWDKMLHFHQTLSQIVVAESARQDYTNVLQKQLSTTSGKSESAVANAVVHTKEPMRLTELNVGADQPCVVHQGSTTHTNAQCSKQIDLRTKIQPDKVYQLIAALTPIVNSTLAERQRAQADKNKRREQSKKDKHKSGDGAGNRPKSDAPAQVKKRKADKQAASDSKSNLPSKRSANDSTADLKGSKKRKTSTLQPV
jgi:hypothetical protein